MMGSQLVPIGEIFNLEKGELQSTKCTPGEFDFITAAEDWKTHHDYTHECEALIIAVAASGSLGRTHYVDSKFISSDLCFILTPKNKDKYPLNLAFYQFVFNSIRPTLVTATKSGTSKESINQANLKKYELPYFDIEQQELWIENIKKTFVNEKLFNSELTYQQTLVKKLRQQILQEAIEGKLTAEWRKRFCPLPRGRTAKRGDSEYEHASVLLERIIAEKNQMIKDKKIRPHQDMPPISDEDKPFSLPPEWVWCRLGDITSILGDGLHGTPNYSQNGEYYFVNGNNLIDGSIQFKNSTKKVNKEEYLKYKKELNDNTILVSINGTLGNVAFYKDEKIILGKSACYFNLLSNLNKDYFKSIIKSGYYLDYALSKASQTTIHNLSLKNMKLFLIPLPPLAEQKAIVAKVEKLFAFCDQLETKIIENKTHAEQLMRAVLKEAFKQK